MSLVTTNDLRERERLAELTLLVIYIQKNKDDGGTGTREGKSLCCIVHDFFLYLRSVRKRLRASFFSTRKM